VIVHPDLWLELIRVLAESCQRNLDVAFWYIPREFNGQAEALANTAASYNAMYGWQVLRG
jgi:hypothetical protein